MPELLRSIVNRLRGHVGNRRAPPRCAAQLEAELVLSVSSGEAGNRANAAAPLRLAGHTRDISLSGLSLVVPSIHVGGQYLTAQNLILEITLKLTTGNVQLRAAPVRYSPLRDDANSSGEDTGDKGYIVGLRITDISEQDRARYEAYLRSIKAAG